MFHKCFQRYYMRVMKKKAKGIGEAGRTVFITGEVYSFVMEQSEYDFLDSFTFIRPISKQVYLTKLKKTNHSLMLHDVLCKWKEFKEAGSSELCVFL